MPQDDETLVDRLIPVNARMNGIAARLGIPQYQNVVIVRGGVQTLLEPKPKVKSMTKYDVQQFKANGIEINQDEVWVEEIPRSYDESQISQSKFILNAQLAPSGQWFGVNASVKFIDRNQLLTYRVLVLKERGR